MGAFDIDYVNYKPREYVPQPLEQLRVGVESLENKHQHALQQQNAVMQYVGSLDLNDAEDEWRAGYINNEIIAPIEEASSYGNMATAMTTATRLAAKVASDPALRERIRYQKEFQNFKTTVQNSSDYDDSVKEYTLAQHKYGYQDKIDDKSGQVIGGSRFDPNYRPVKQVDVAALTRQAQQMAIASQGAGGGEQIYYKTSAGGYTTDINKAESELAYYSTGSKFERVPEKQLRDAMENLIANTPGARESIEQDYRVAAWKTKQASDRNGTLTISEATDDKGILLNADQYLEKRVNPFFKTASYNRVWSQMTPLDGMKAQWQRVLAKQEAAVADKPIVGTESTPVTMQIATVQERVGTRNIASNGMDNMLSQLGVQGNATDDTNIKYNKLKNAISQIPDPVMRSQMLYQANEMYNTVIDTDKSLEPYYAKATKRERQASEFMGIIDSGGDLAQLKNNPYAEQWNKNVNDIFGTDGEYYTIRINNSKALANTVSLLSGGQPNGHRALGIEINGNSIVIPKSRINSLPQINKAIEAGGRGIYGTDKGTNWSADASQRVVYDVLDKNRSSLKTSSTSLFGKRKGGGATFGAGYVTRIYSDAEKNLQNLSKYSERDQIPFTTTFEIIPMEAAADRLLARTTDKWSDYNQALASVQAQVTNSVKMGDYGGLPMYISVDGNNFVEVTEGGLRARLGNIPRALVDKENKNFAVGSALEFDGKPATVLNYSAVSESDKSALESTRNILKEAGFDMKNSVQFLVPGLTATNLDRYIMDNPTYGAKSEIISKRKMGQKDFNIYNGGRGSINMKADDTGYYWLEDNRGNTTPIGNINDASKVFAKYKTMNNLEMSYGGRKLSEIPREEGLYVVEKIAESMNISTDNTNRTNEENIAIADVLRTIFIPE